MTFMKNKSQSEYTLECRHITATIAINALAIIFGHSPINAKIACNTEIVCIHALQPNTKSHIFHPLLTDFHFHFFFFFYFHLRCQKCQRPNKCESAKNTIMGRQTKKQSNILSSDSYSSFCFVKK